MDQVLRFIDDQWARFVGELATWVAIPAISSDPAHKADMRNHAEHLVKELRRKIGSDDLDGLMREHANDRTADFVCVSDTAHLGIKSAAHPYDELSRLEDKR
jgi:hypothetical protein